MKLSYNKSRNRFELACTFDERMIPKENKFRWDPLYKTWYTDKSQVAARLRKFADEKTKENLPDLFIHSSPWTGSIRHNADQTLKPFQESAVRFALSRSRSYLALEMGLGKTPISAAFVETDSKSFSDGSVTIVIVPPFLVQNTIEEYRKWTSACNIFKYDPREDFSCDPVVIVPDSMLIKSDVLSEIYRIIKRTRSGGRLVVDEAHRFKNDSAKRTKALFSLTPHFKKVVLMSGTPMPNRPIELYSVLSNLAPETIDHMSKFKYGVKYCAAYEGEWGWDYSGASNMPELARRVHEKFMLRMKIKDVLKELPEKLEEPVVLSDEEPPALMRMENVLKRLPVEDLVKEILVSEEGESGDELHIGKYRRLLGEAKIPEALKFIQGILEDSDESVLVFGIHTKVLETLNTKLAKYSPLLITGKTPVGDRQAMVKDFQTNPLRRVMIGNIQAAGTGFTMTKAHRVVFVEFSWVPAENDQALARAHRIGQKETVLAQYLVFKDSVDRTVLATNLGKKRVTAHI